MSKTPRRKKRIFGLVTHFACVASTSASMVTSVTQLALVKEGILSCHNKEETILFTNSPYYGNLNLV